MNDAHRPQWHFTAARNWINDPNGLIQVDGVYHLFYQYNPNGAFWGTMHWGHATSQDLVHWAHAPIAIAPDANGPDADGCFSGVIVVDDDVSTMIYTGVRGGEELACIARSDRDLVMWEKDPRNPVIRGLPDGVDATIFRDHTVWRDGDRWTMGIGSGVDGLGAVLSYASSNLVDWQYRGPLVEEPVELNPEGVAISTGWECPDFFALGDRHVLVACEWDGDPIAVSSWTGRFDGDRFHPTRKDRIDGGRSFYAPQSFRAEDGRRIQFGWLRENRSAEDQLPAGWSGAMTLPRELWLDRDGRLCSRPAAEVELLRGRHIPLVPNDDIVLPFDGRSVEIAGSVARDQVMELAVRVDLDTNERTVMRFAPSVGRVHVRMGQSTANPTAQQDDLVMSVADDADRWDVRVFVDRSAIEVFVNDRHALAVRAYPTGRADGIRLAVDGRDAIAPFTIWEMR